MKLRFTIKSVYEIEVPGDDFDQAVKDINADTDAYVQKAERKEQSTAFVEEISERGYSCDGTVSARV